MPRYETRSSQFGLLGGLRQTTSDLILVAEPASVFAPEARKGRLYIIAELDRDVPRGQDACQMVLNTIRRQFYGDSSYSVTAALRKAVSAANKALYHQNFGAAPDKRALVGVTCAVVKERDLYLAQVAPTQCFVLAEGRLRALPAVAAWSGGTPAAQPLIKPRALGTSLTVEPELYRAVLEPGDSVLLSNTRLAAALDREALVRLLRGSDPDLVVEGLHELSRRSGPLDAHALSFSLVPALSAAARNAPLSREGISERVALALRSAGAGVGRVAGDLARVLPGSSKRAARHSAELRREHARREDARMTEVPEESYGSVEPLAPPRALDLGESIDARVEEQRERERMRPSQGRRRQGQEPLPPSAYLGEGSVPGAPYVQRRVDLSDTPGMAALGNGTRRGASGPPRVEPTFGERIMAPVARLFGGLGSVRPRGRRQPIPSAMPPPRRQSGLSYRRQRPPFPWLLLFLLISLVTLLIVYGRTLAIDNAQRQTDDALQAAEQAVASIRAAADESEARQRLAVAGEALAAVRASGVISGSQELRERLALSQREYDRALLSLQKLSYFADLTEIGRHPQLEANAAFTSLVVPPAPTGITNTVGFSSIYALDGNAGVLYRMPKSGGAFEPFLQPSDGGGAGSVKAIAWRIDNIVAVTQNESGAFLYFFRSNDEWRFSNLGGSEEWGRAVSEHFRLVTYDGNLYFWGAAPGQVLKYRSGQPADLYDPWIKNDGGKKTDTAIDVAVDGEIYLLQPDGSVLQFSANEFKREMPAPEVNPPLVTPIGFFVTGGPDEGYIFMVDALNERIIQLDKQTGALIQQIRARPDGPLRLDQLAAVYVDDASGSRPVLYMVNGGRVLRASLPDRPPPFREQPTAGPAPAATATAAESPAPTP